MGDITRPAGEVRVEVHADTDPFEPELERGLRQAEHDAGPLLDEIGESWGERLADSTADELGRHGPEFARSMEHSLEQEKITVRSDVDYDESIFSRLTHGVTEAIEDAFDFVSRRAGRPGGPTDRIGRGFSGAIADAIGAGFNVSGRSPLIILLIPIIGIIVALILGAVQAVASLVALLTTLPALVAAIGLQVGALALAWDGVGDAIGAAFEAKNAKELNEAIKGLTPSAQEFVRSLLPLRDLFRDIKALSQEAFFRAFGTTVTELIATLGPILRSGLPAIAGAMGELFRQLGLFFGSATFTTFIEKVIPATLAWLDRFGLGFVSFLEGLVALGTAALPYFERLGAGLAKWFGEIGQWLTDVADDPSFLRWLERMESTLGSVFELLGAVIGFIAVFMDELDKAGGEDVIREFSRAFEMLSAFLLSEAGMQAMRGLVNLSILMIRLFTVVILGILTVIASLQAFGTFIVEDLGPSIGGAFDEIGEKITEFGKGIVEGLVRILSGGTAIAQGALDSARGKIDDLEAFVRSIPGRIKTTLDNLVTMALNAGRNFMDSLIQGIRDKIQPLTDAARFVANILAAYLPGSPAEKGPLSGEGYALYRGQHLVRDFIKGIASELPQLQNMSVATASAINFGPGSVVARFEGALPTAQQAQTTGTAVANGIAKQLARRDTRLAVRMI